MKPLPVVCVCLTLTLMVIALCQKLHAAPEIFLTTRTPFEEQTTGDDATNGFEAQEVENPSELDRRKAEYAERCAMQAPTSTARIRRQIATVSSESLRESLENLHRINMFTWPGVFRSGSIILQSPDSAYLNKLARHDVHSILSNRRFLKVLQGLRTLEPHQAGELISTFLSEAINQYEASLLAYAEKNAPQFMKGKQGAVERSTIGSSWRGSTEEGSDEHLLLGDRYNVLALIWLAGIFEAPQCHDQIKAVTRSVEDIRQNFRDNKYYVRDKQDYAGAVRMNRHLGLYSLHVISFGLARTAGSANSLEAELVIKGVTTPQLLAAGFDSMLTPYDKAMPYKSEFDQSKSRIPCYADMRYEVFEELVSEVCYQN